MANLEKLPVELLETILCHIERPSDLKALCLTSRRLRLFAIAKLYRQIIIDIRCRELVESLVGGLRSLQTLYPSSADEIMCPIKSLVILDDLHGASRPTHRPESWDVYTKSLSFYFKDPERLIKNRITDILNSLPFNALKVFRFASWEPLDAFNVELLFSTQQGIEDLSFSGSIDHIFVSRTLGDGENSLYNHLLAFDVNFEDSTQQWDRQAYRKELKKALGLASNVNRFSLSGSFLDSSQSRNGSRSSVFFFQLVSLSNFAVISNLSLSGIDLKEVLLLSSLNGLEELLLEGCAGGPGEKLKRHAPTLRKLGLLLWDPLRSNPDFFSQCPLLEQLAITVMVQEDEVPTMSDSSMTFVTDILKFTPELRTLHLDLAYIDRRERGNTNSEFATSFFDHLHTHGLAPKLGVLSICGVHPLNSDFLTPFKVSIGQQFFIRPDRSISERGHPRETAFSCPKGVVKYFEPVSDILDFACRDREDITLGMPSLGYRSLQIR
ncbi:hypothetical protein NA57DRAFT_53391 [Rhizodiscina lignyota]|uniref:F-box domain-containing protein n=1 Tax=Rhizodiscina lignyota TaxID=1504668 RepID=A0A9P4ILE5_9PEZI|nr:hypothetical protein NA57DRAFT_53391 [Rhizodiscina lignyota]